MNRISIILCILISALSSHAATAESMLKRSADKIKEAESLHVTYTASADGNTTEGMLMLQGEMFTISSPGMKSWYDGTTQWTYASQIGEVNIITPTDDELQQINPLVIIQSFATAYNAKAIGSSGEASTLRLTAKNTDSDITTAEISISDKTLYPTRIVLTMSNRQKVTINIKNVQPGGKLPASNFRFDTKRYPGVPVVDLR